MAAHSADALKGLKQGERLRLHGYAGASKAFELARVLVREQRPLVLIVADLKEAMTWQRDLRFFLPAEIAVDVFPSLDILPYYHLSPNPDAIHDQLNLLWRLTRAKAPFALIAPLSAAARRLIPRKVFLDHTEVVRAGEARDRDGWAQHLIQNAYQRAPLVEDRGTFAIRGGILDLFSPAHEYPVRVEFFGDTIESIRLFNPETQKSLGEAAEIAVIPAHPVLMEELPSDWRGRLKKACDDQDVPKSERDPVQESFAGRIYFNGIETYLPFVYGKTATLFDYLPNETILGFSDWEGLRAHQGRALEELEEHRGKSTSVERIFRPDEIFLTGAELEDGLAYFPALDFADLGSSEGGAVTVSMESNALLQQKISAGRHREDALEPLVADLNAKRLEGTHIYLVAGSPAQKERLKDLLARYELPIVAPETDADRQQAVRAALASGEASPFLQILLGPISQGFYWPGERQWWITDEEIFGQKVRRAPRKAAGEAFSSFSELMPGDYIVHQDHGIGVYRQLATLTINKVTNDFLLLEYLGGDKLYVPVDQLDRISRYSAQEGNVPLLDKMGGASWVKVRERVKRATRRLARELLELQAQRMAAKGFAFSPRGALFEEFEATFPYDETEDQLKAIEDVLADMESERPMDRLVCGDVGYGKTEVAIRAAFKAALDHKQVAVLVPTTVLAFQHYETFKKRFEKDALSIALLSRFQSAGEQKQIVEKLAKGEIDIVIATHRLLSQDISFRDLGLLIIDEEHRFGVAQKEKIKKLKALVDVVTLTATPIPRTLNFALTGIRDLSIINTPPADRLAVRTYVTYFDEGAIREAILREIKRGGQVFFVHNRVQTIQSMKDRLNKIVPEATVRIGHGQMPEEELEEIMLDFMGGKFQVLLCTTIIESGLDIPAANTILINRADAMGLAQLYQLRGRVGRSHHRAYCYLLIPEDKLVTAVAKKRLSVIERFTELGSGFKIASHDLEIRGAGNILGPEQSGQIAAVGYDLYVQLLEEAVNELKGGAMAEEVVPELKLGVAASIPPEFIPDTQLRLVLYKQLSSTKTQEDCLNLKDEWLDRFGALPPPVENLISLICVKNLARQLKISGVSHQGGTFVYQVHPQSPVPTDYFLKRAQKEPRKHKILADGKFVVTEAAPSEEAVLKAALRHLAEMAQAR